MYLERWLNGLKEGNTLHAVLLCGPAGVGKKQTARRAAALFLLGRDDPDALYECPFYKEYAPEQSETGANKYADPAREVCEFLNAGTFSKGRHAVLFPDLHLYNETTQNILLKTLEEPPEDSLLLVTGLEEGILPTIRSRCMSIRLGARPLREVADELVQSGVPKAQAELAASLSDGIPGLARKMAGEEYTAFRAETLAALKDAFFAAPPFDAVQALCTEKKKGDPGKANAVLDTACTLLHDALSEQWKASRIFAGDAAEIRHKLASSFTKAELRGMMDRTLRAGEQLSGGAGVKPVMDAWLANLLPARKK